VSLGVSQTPAPAPAPSRASVQSGRGDWRTWAHRYPFTAATVVSVVLAALSAAVFPTVASYDPWAWI
jgi:hypothetical protein